MLLACCVNGEEYDTWLTGISALKRKSRFVVPTIESFQEQVVIFCISGLCYWNEHA